MAVQIAGPILGFANPLGAARRGEHTTLPFGQSANGKPNCERQNWKPRRVSVNKSYKDRYTSAIREAEQNILAGKEVVNQDINGKSLIMQLFREHGISVPLKTQGWIINTLHSIRYSPQSGPMELPLP